MDDYEIGEILELVRSDNTNYDDLMIKVVDGGDRCEVLERRHRHTHKWIEVDYDKDRTYSLKEALSSIEEIISHGVE